MCQLKTLFILALLLLSISCYRLGTSNFNKASPTVTGPVCAYTSLTTLQTFANAALACRHGYCYFLHGKC